MKTFLLSLLFVSFVLAESPPITALEIGLYNFSVPCIENLADFKEVLTYENNLERLKSSLFPPNQEDTVYLIVEIYEVNTTLNPPLLSDSFDQWVWSESCIYTDYDLDIFPKFSLGGPAIRFTNLCRARRTHILSPTFCIAGNATRHSIITRGLQELESLVKDPQNPDTSENNVGCVCEQRKDKTICNHKESRFKDHQGQILFSISGFMCALTFGTVIWINKFKPTTKPISKDPWDLPAAGKKVNPPNFTYVRLYNSPAFWGAILGIVIGSGVVIFFSAWVIGAVAPIGILGVVFLIVSIVFFVTWVIAFTILSVRTKHISTAWFEYRDQNNKIKPLNLLFLSITALNLGVYGAWLTFHGSFAALGLFLDLSWALPLITLYCTLGIHVYIWVSRIYAAMVPVQGEIRLTVIKKALEQILYNEFEYVSGKVDNAVQKYLNNKGLGYYATFIQKHNLTLENLLKLNEQDLEKYGLEYAVKEKISNAISELKNMSFSDFLKETGISFDEIVTFTETTINLLNIPSDIKQKLTDAISIIQAIYDEYQAEFKAQGITLDRILTLSETGLEALKIPQETKQKMSQSLAVLKQLKTIYTGGSQLNIDSLLTTAHSILGLLNTPETKKVNEALNTVKQITDNFSEELQKGNISLIGLTPAVLGPLNIPDDVKSKLLAAATDLSVLSSGIAQLTTKPIDQLTPSDLLAIPAQVIPALSLPDEEKQKLLKPLQKIQEIYNANSVLFQQQQLHISDLVNLAQEDVNLLGLPVGTKVALTQALSALGKVNLTSWATQADTIKGNAEAALQGLAKSGPATADTPASPPDPKKKKDKKGKQKKDGNVNKDASPSAETTTKSVPDSASVLKPTLKDLLKYVCTNPNVPSQLVSQSDKDELMKIANQYPVLQKSDFQSAVVTKLTQEPEKGLRIVTNFATNLEEEAKEDLKPLVQAFIQTINKYVNAIKDAVQKIQNELGLSPGEIVVLAIVTSILFAALVVFIFWGFTSITPSSSISLTLAQTVLVALVGLASQMVSQFKQAKSQFPASDIGSGKLEKKIWDIGEQIFNTFKNKPEPASDVSIEMTPIA